MNRLTKRFAPGVLTGYRRPRKRSLWRMLKWAAVLVVWAVVVGLWLGVMA